MQDIPVLMFVVACSTDLLFCKEVSDQQSLYADMPACLSAREEVLAQRLDPRRPVTQVRCRYDPAVASGGVARRPSPALIN